MLSKIYDFGVIFGDNIMKIRLIIRNLFMVKEVRLFFV